MRRVIIKRKNTAIGEARLVHSILGKARGLMFTLKPKSLIFASQKKEYVPLHMWFVFFAIDVLYLDENKRVIEVVPNFKPFQMHFPKVKSQYVIELPKGTITQHKIALHDKLSF